MTFILFIGTEPVNPIEMQGGGWIYPTFLFFEFLKFGFVYQSEIFHGNKAFKMPSDGYWNIDIYAETGIEMYKKLFRTRYSYVGGGVGFHLHQDFEIPILLVGFHLHFQLWNQIKEMENKHFQDWNRLIWVREIDSTWFRNSIFNHFGIINDPKILFVKTTQQNPNIENIL